MSDPALLVPVIEPPVDTSTITLKNPVSQHFAAFIFGNATKCDEVVTENEAAGQTLVICGAGPSLNETAPKFCPRGDQVWGCNSAATWLIEHGHKITHAFTVDQTAHMVEEWASAPDLTYLIASTVHPHLTDYLLSKGRTLRWFHNYVGVAGQPVSYSVCRSCDKMGDATDTACSACGSSELDANTTSYEEWLYATLYPVTIKTGSGLNATTRAIDLALFMGFKKIYVLGADCALQVNKPMPKGAVNGSPEHLAWLERDVVMHADGGSALASQASAITLEGVIDGRRWLTKPDMMITAVWLRAMKLALGSKLSIIGDTLPRAILNKDQAFVDRLPSLIGHDGRPWVGKFEERVA